MNKTMLLAIASAALLALPSAAAGQEIHFKGVTTFTGNGPASAIQVVSEPKISCTATAVTGKLDSGSTTTGSITITRTGCSAEFLGIKGNCNTAGDAAQTATSSAAFHLITTSAGKPGILLTPVTNTVICVGFSRIEITGNGLIGTISNPACGASSKTLGLKFEQAGGTQNHVEYTGVKYDLSAHTEDSAGKTTGSSGTAGREATTTLESTTAGTLECT